MLVVEFPLLELPCDLLKQKLSVLVIREYLKLERDQEKLLEYMLSHSQASLLVDGGNVHNESY